MTRQKSFKQRIRARMEKTGESYTAARRQLVARAERSATTQDAGSSDAVTNSGETRSEAAALETEAESPSVPPAAAPETEPSSPAVTQSAVPETESPSPAVTPPMPDETVEARTGRRWEEWFRILDDWGATGREHAEIARWLVAEHGVGGWWAQGVTVAYEQARGMRRPYQRREGFSASASKTVAVPVERLYEAFANEDLRRRWLGDAELQPRSASAPKSIRFDGEGTTRVTVGFLAKGAGKSQVGLEHERLPDAASVEQMKAYWRERLAALKAMLED